MLFFLLFHGIHLACSHPKLSHGIPLKNIYIFVANVRQTLPDIVRWLILHYTAVTSGYTTH